jgi:hypothetical protein
METVQTLSQIIDKLQIVFDDSTLGDIPVIQEQLKTIIKQLKTKND